VIKQIEIFFTETCVKRKKRRRFWAAILRDSGEWEWSAPLDQTTVDELTGMVTAAFCRGDRVEFAHRAKDGFTWYVGVR